jgi:threonine/homoserine/homoserine lactone efflux protein
MLTFAAAVFFLIGTPGPGVLTTAGVGSGFGWAAGLRFLAGLFLGTNGNALIVVSGLWAIVMAEPAVRTVLAVASLGYFGWLAAKIALAGGGRVAFIEAERAPGFVNGLMLQFINPKAYAVNMFLFTDFAFYPGNLGLEVALKLLIINAIWVPVHLAWLGAGVGLRRLDLGPRAQRAINVAMAGSLVAVVLLAALA